MSRKFFAMNPAAGQSKPMTMAANNDTSSICSQVQRHRVIKEHCSLQKPTPVRNIYKNIFVDDFHRVIVCLIYKSGSSSLRNWLGVHSPRWDGENPPEKDFSKHKPLKQVGISRLVDFGKPGERDRRLQEYFKFVLVRHPFDRLVSAFVEKFTKPNQPYYPNLFRDVIRNTINVDVRRRSLTFTEFIHMINTHYRDRRFRNEHWTTYDEMCNPCGIQYDVIAKIETFEHDIAPFLARYNVTRNGAGRDVLLNKNSARNPQNRLLETTEYFRNISESSQAALYRIYKKDFALFGYRWSSSDNLCSYGSSLSDDGRLEQCC